MLNLVWLLPYYSTRAGHDVSWAWRLAGAFIPISYGWAAGDVSLAAYIQSDLSENQICESLIHIFDWLYIPDRTSSNPANKHVSPLGAVMGFLYSIYIVLYAILGTVLGNVLDKDFAKNGNIKSSLIRVAG